MNEYFGTWVDRADRGDGRRAFALPPEARVRAEQALSELLEIFLEIEGGRAVAVAVAGNPEITTAGDTAYKLTAEPPFINPERATIFGVQFRAFWEVTLVTLSDELRPRRTIDFRYVSIEPEISTFVARPDIYDIDGEDEPN